MDLPGRLARFAVVALVLAASTAAAEPYLALREGYLCSQCHVNRTGGGKRNSFGVGFAQTVMPLWKVGPWDEGSPSSRGALGWFTDPRLGDHVSLGAELRFQNVTTFAATGSYLGQKLSAPEANNFAIPEGQLYVEMSLVKNYLLLYLDETVAPEGASAREAFVMAQYPALGLYLKAGRFLLPYGLRLPDDNIFVRQVTGFNYANQDLGVEAGIEPGPAFFHIAVTNGNGGGADNNVKKQITGTAGVAIKHGRIGLCYSWDDSSTDQSGSTRRVAGGYVGTGWGRFSALAEADAIRDWTGPPDGKTTPTATANWQWAFYGEIDLLAYKGINLKAAYDFNDPDIDLANNGRERFTLGFDAMVLPFLGISAYYYLRRDIPQKVLGNQDMLVLQIHAYL